MKNLFKCLGIIALVAIIGFGMVSCGGDDDGGGGGGDPPLTGNITISPTTAVVGTELTAAYSGNETDIKYQWKRGSTNVGTNSNKYTPDQAGSHTVTVSAAGFKSKTSTAVNVTAGGEPPGPGPGSGLTWMQVVEADTQFTSGSINCITFADSKFVAGGADKLVSSTDGVTWTSVGTYTGSEQFNSIFYGGPDGEEAFVAVGRAGVIAYITSTNTVERAGAANPFGGSNNEIFDIAYGAGKYVAVGNGKIRYSDNNALSASTTWTAVTSSVFSIGEKISSIAWGNDKFVIVFESGGNGKTATSTDGETWTEGGQAGSNGLTAVIWDGTRFVAGNKVGIVYTSADAVTWTQATESIQPGVGRTVNDIAFGSNIYVAVAEGGIVSQSANALTWAFQSIAGGTGAANNGVAFGANRFVVVGNSRRIYYSNTLE